MVNARILYLDDEEPLVFLMRRMLEHLGYRVAGFTRSDEALAAFNAAPAEFDLVMTDMSMPGMSGVDAQYTSPSKLHHDVGKRHCNGRRSISPRNASHRNDIWPFRAYRKKIRRQLTDSLIER